MNKKIQTKISKIDRITANKKKSKKMQIIKEYILNNIREYSIVVIMLLIGIFIGVMFINNCEEEKQLQIKNYINEYIQNVKDEGNINYISLTKNSIQKNIILGCLLWFAGTTIIGIPIVLGIILFRGGCLGFSIAASINTLGLGKGLSFVLITMFMQNIVLIPAIATIGVSSLNLYKAIVKDKRKEKIKLAIIKHTALSFIMSGILIIASIIEINVSCKILVNFIKYF